MRSTLAAAVMLTLAAGLQAGETLLASCPVSLTNPDGQALDLERYELRVAVHGPLALVEMEMTFRNPEPRQMEGRFLYLLPPGATVSRFAKEVNGKLMEGEVVERKRAQRIYRQILHTMRDPALLEQDQGNRFSARVFPIPANGYTRLLLSYSELLTQKNGRRLTVPLTGLPKMKAFTATLVYQDLPESAYHSAKFFDKIERTDTQPQLVTRTVTDFKPEEDLVVNFAGLKDPHRATVIRSGEFQMMAYRPEIAVKKDAGPMPWCFYFDTSASGADMEQRRLEAIRHLNDTSLQVNEQVVFAFDIDVVRCKVSSKTISAEAVTRFLRARHSIGATNLEAALKHIGERARATKQPTRFVLVSDGIATFGAREPRELVAALGEWPEQHVLHALVLGPKQDKKTLSAIVEKTRGRIVTVSLGSDMEKQIERASAELRQPLGASFEFQDEGAEWVFPKSFRDVRPGDEIVVFSKLKEGAKGKPVVIQRGADGKAIKEVPLTAPTREAPSFAPLLEREAYAAYLSHLEKLEQETTAKTKIADLRKQRIAISVKHRVLCPLTSLLVLETEDDYARFDIDRNALADVMIVGNKGIELRQRTAKDLFLRPAVRKRADFAKGKKEAAKAAEVDAKGPELKDAEGLISLNNSRDGLVEHAYAARRVLVQNGLVEAEVADHNESADDADEGRSSGQRGGRVAQEAQPAEERRPEPHRVVADRVAPTTPEAPRTPAAQPAKRKQPTWVSQYGKLLAPDQLNALQAKIAAAPRDRRLRNTYADGLVKKQDWDALQALTFEWLPFDPENPQVFEFLGKSATRLNDPKTALRAFTSIAEVAPNRAALLGRAGWLLLIADQHEMAIQLFREALKKRDDNPNLYRGLAMAYWLKGDFAAAADTLEGARERKFHQRYGDVKRVLNEELGYVYRAWLSAVRTQADDTHPRVQERAKKSGVKLDRKDALRVTLGWETDANDVDLHVVDPAGEECFYSHKNTRSGLKLYSDQTQGLGPEVIRCDKVDKGIYHIGVNYYSAGPMGVSRGVIVVLRPNDDGTVERPTIVPFCLVEGGADMRHLTAVEFR